MAKPPRLTGMNLFLYATNPEKSAAWYRALGFTQEAVHDLPGGVKVFSFDVNGRQLTIGPPLDSEPEHLRRWLRAKPWGTGSVVMPQVDDVDALHARAQEVGAEIVEAPMDQMWGSRTVVLRDPDGYWLMFEQPKAPAKRAATKPKAAKKKAKKTAKR